jgi:hypothetical protein
MIPDQMSVKLVFVVREPVPQKPVSVRANTGDLHTIVTVYSLHAVQVEYGIVFERIQVYSMVCNGVFCCTLYS